MKSFLVGLVTGVVLVPLAFLIIGYLGGLSVHATADPPAWERQFAHRALEASLARQARELRNPITVSADALLAGMKLYVNNCSGCHGKPGAPSPWGTENFYPRVPQLAEHAAHLDAAEMFVVVKRGIRYSGMGAWDSMLSDEDIWRIVTFLSAAHDLPPAVDAIWNSRTLPSIG
ncbi:MAG: c-type cytochrome [Steroidobacteraceae bacterium]